ncbi:dTDP-glucose 4,6-dehydratase [Pseudomonas sp. SJZ085]|uniref:NAD-dependent epimerase/dehydratase family protein n=1 Tax=unclassified Pseudomonas TaxID=196821 RepID=UPI00119A34F4|nr:MULTISPECIES: NAD(P)-dependent oxidoreductase [unclassified Pseudomonas]TWC21738.1 dTDP-glucose 4,6-dehydratase [Pseudomonas sp. SJZ074]TWC39388.1 dTDP-glucose 4,6-dehydratase [Pseudomonas sp. SJZ085]
MPDGLSSVLAGLSLRNELAGAHLLLTGGTGFFGRWLLALLRYLNGQGAAITVTITSRDPSRFLTANPEYRECTWISWFTGDIRDLVDLPGRVPDLILHAAADTSATANAHPLELFNTLVDGARRVFDLAARNSSSRVLLTGSGAQYGSLSSAVGVCESYSGACASNVAASAYAEGKRAQETLGALYAQCYGIKVVMARCFAFAGPGLPLDGHFAIGNFVRDALYEEEIVLNSNGQAVRSYLHGADLAAWLLTLLVRGEPGVAYNVGSDEAISIADLAKRVVARIAPHKPVTILGRSEGGGRSFYVPDIGRARGLGLDVWTSLDASIDSMANWARGVER